MAWAETAEKTARRAARLPAEALILPIRIYQLTISRLLGQRCRFHPSCSNYCIDALKQHGMVHGLWLGFIRICKCQPFHPGGCDPVPERKMKPFERTRL